MYCIADCGSQTFNGSLFEFRSLGEHLYYTVYKFGVLRDKFVADLLVHAEKNNNVIGIF